MVDLYQEVSEAIEIERACRTHFAYDFKIKHIIADNLETSKNSHGTVFKTTENEVYAYFTASTPLTFGDIKRIIRSMNLKAAVYLPPAGNHDYFKAYGQQAFQVSFPGRRITNDDNLSFYQSLAPYSPALVKIAEINGEIRGYIPVMEAWYKAVDYTYRHIEVRS